MEKLKDSLTFWSIPFVFFFAWYLREIFLIITAALIFGSAIQAWALWLKRVARLPFLAGVFLVYLSLIAILIVSVYGLTPILREQLTQLIPNLQVLLEGLEVKHDFLINQFVNSASGVLGNVGPFLFSVLGGVFSAALILILSFYFTTHCDLYRHAIAFLPIRNKKQAEQIWLSARQRFAAWLAAQLFLMIVVGIATTVLMASFKMPNAVLIGTIAGLAEIIPVLGPILAAAVALLVTLAVNPTAIGWILLGFIIIQQIENNILVPLVVKRALAINPVFTLIAIMIGGAIGGILGVMTVLPIVLFGIEVYKSVGMSPGVAHDPIE